MVRFLSGPSNAEHEYLTAKAFVVWRAEDLMIFIPVTISHFGTWS
jgi:hypothetical protein